MFADGGHICSQSALTQELLLSVVEQVKFPLVNIARSVELASLQPDGAEIDLGSIRATADAALYLIDSYLLGVRLSSGDAEFFELEPVSLSSVLYDASSQLQPFARNYGVDLDLQLDGKYGPVMAHRRALQAALVSLGYAFIEALPATGLLRPRLQFSAHRCRYGIVAGLYCEAEQVTVQTLRMGRRLYGRAHQPLGSISHTSGAGVFVADAIFHAMQAKLTVSRHHSLHGLGTVLSLNPQLQLV